MNTRRTLDRRVGENEVQEEIPLQAEKVEQVPQGAQSDQVPNVEGGNEFLVFPLELSNNDIREVLLALARAVTTQDNLRIVRRITFVKSNMLSRLRDFVRMNPPIFLGSKVGEDPQEFLDGGHKVLSDIGVTSMEKSEFASYKKREVAQVWYTQWKDNRLVELGSI